jgi:hypothetical protein
MKVVIGPTGAYVGFVSYDVADLTIRPRGINTTPPITRLDSLISQHLLVWFE